MASIPVAGVPRGPFPAPRRADVGGERTLFGFDEAQRELLHIARRVPSVAVAIVTEIGLFGEKATKEHTPVDTGRLRASIGHAEGGANPADAVFDVDRRGDVTTVTWGTHVDYAVPVEYGFSVDEPRLVLIEGVGFRWVRPFSYRGAHMFELGLQTAAKAMPAIVERHVAPLLAA